MKSFKSFLIISAFIFASFSLTACNTVQGVGKDISAGGQVLQKASGEHSTTTKSKSTTTTSTPTGTAKVTTTTTSARTPANSQTPAVTY